MILRFLLIGLLILAALSAPATGADKDSPVRVFDRKALAEEPQSAFDMRLQTARRMITDKAYQSASALLEQLYEHDETDVQVIGLLLMCYQHLGYHPKAEMMSRRLIEQYPGNYTYYLRLAESLANQSRLDEARDVYGEAMTIIPDTSYTQIGILLGSMIESGLEEDALSFIDRVRQRSGDPALFAFDRGTIMERRHEYGGAIREFFLVLDDSGRVAVQSEKKIQAMLDYPETSELAEDTLADLTASGANARAAKVLSAFYLRSGRFEEAIKYAMLQDSLQDLKGNGLLGFMRTCRERGLHVLTVRVAEHLLARYPDQPLIGETYFLYAEALGALGRYDEAIATYDSIVTGFPRPQDKAAALTGIGRLYLDYLHDYDRALVYFDSVVNSLGGGYAVINALLARPMCHLRKGDLETARLSFEKLQDRRLNDDQNEMVAYHLALLDFFEKEFDSSEVALRKLLVDYPRGFYVNDALQLLRLMDAAEGSDDLLYEFSGALLFEQMRMPDSMAARLRQVADAANRALADVSLYRLVILHLEQADSAAALACVDRLAEEFPESYYLPYGLKAKADLLLARPNGTESARSIYRRLLADFPDYPFISEVRKTMRLLEGEA